MALDDVRIQLDDFEGPLDLLLFLIRRDELDVTDIPIARVTGQYLDLLRSGGIERIDVDQASEFLVMAATLMEIKSRMLMPPPPGATNPAGADPSAALADIPSDPRTDLVRQLLAYKKYRDAAAMLDRRADEWSRRFPGGGALAGESPALGDAAAGGESGVADAPDFELDDVDAVDLARAFARVMESIDFSRLGDHRVKDDETPIALHAEDILDRLRRDTAASPSPQDSGGIEFRSLFEGRTRAEAIGLFLALLELIRQQRIAARQDRVHDRIMVCLAPEPAARPAEPQSRE